ncbi:MAG: TIGR04086 family membrane protein [Clostridia bacterium]
MEKDLKPKVTIEQSEFKQNTIRIIKGSILAILISVILLFIYATILTYTDIQETTILPVILTVVGISILTGSMISVRKIRKNGMLNGAIVGLIYIIILYLSSSMCLVGFSLTLNSFVMLIVGIITGIIGGIIGVNINRK